MFNNSEIINEYVTKDSAFVIIQATIGLIGIICNTLAICVFERRQQKKTLLLVLLESESFHGQLDPTAYFSTRSKSFLKC